MSERFNWYEAAAKGKARLPDAWKMVRWEAHGDPKHPSAFEINGAVYPPKTKGPQAGKPNYRKPVLGTKATVWLTEAEVLAFQSAWGKRTGKCVECFGTGQLWTGWHFQTGNSYKPCPHCAQKREATHD